MTPVMPVIVTKSASAAKIASSGRRTRTLLIVGQLAVSFMLLIAAGLTLRSLARLQNVDAGFDPDNVLTARLDLNWSKYKSHETILRFSDRLLAEARVLPGVTHAAVAHTFPLNRMDPHSHTFEIRGREQKPGMPPPVAHVRSASADYFAAVGIRLIRGRLYDDKRVRTGARLAAKRTCPGPMNRGATCVSCFESTAIQPQSPPRCAGASGPSIPRSP